MDQVCYGISNSFPINQQSCENTALSELQQTGVYVDEADKNIHRQTQKSLSGFLT